MQDPRHRFFKGLILVALLAAALAIRAAVPRLFSVAGSDIPEHIAAALHMGVAGNGNAPWLALVGHALSFNHGYTLITACHILYQFTFAFVGVPVSPLSLATLHGFLGICSLLVFFMFVRANAGFRTACLLTAILAVIPTHVGVSSANSGYQIIKLAGLYLSLWRLQEWMRIPTSGRAALYAASLVVAIGSCVDFFLVLFLNGLYVFWNRDRSPGAWPSRVIIGIGAGMPVAAILAWHVYAAHAGTPSGILARLADVATPVHPTFAPWSALRNLTLMVGPVALPALVAVMMPRIWGGPLWIRIAAVQWLWEFAVISLSGRASWTSHILNLAAPSLILVWELVRPLRRATLVMAMGGLASALLTASIIFRLGPPEAPSTYGSRQRSPSGVEALALAVREQALPSFRTASVKKLGLAIDFEGAWFYLGENTLGLDDLRGGLAGRYDHVLYVHRPGVDTPFNNAIASIVSNRPPLVEIVSGQSVLMRGVVDPPVDHPAIRLDANAGYDRFFARFNRVEDYRFPFLP